MMRAEIIKIGNSQGVRLPKVILEQCGFERSVELIVEGHCLILKPISERREGWDQAFQSMAEYHDEEPLWPEPSESAFEQEEWTW